MANYDTIARIKEQIKRIMVLTEHSREEVNQKIEIRSVQKLYTKIMLELINLRRAYLHKLEKENKYDDYVIHNMENNLDLEEARLNKK